MDQEQEADEAHGELHEQLDPKVAKAREVKAMKLEKWSYATEVSNSFRFPIPHPDGRNITRWRTHVDHA